MACGFDELSSIETDRQPHIVRFDGQIMTLILGTAVTRYNLSNPSEPMIVEEFMLPRSLSLIVFRENLLVGTADNRLYIFDITDQANPIELSVTSMIWSGFRDLKLHGDYAYIANATGPASYQGVRIYDISDPATPVPVTILFDGPDGRDIEIVDDILYATSDTKGLVMYDLSNPGNPLLIDSAPIPFESGAYSFTIDDGIVYATEYGPSLTTVDITAPSTPILLDRIEFEGQPLGIGLIDNWIYTTDYDYTVTLVDRTDPSNLSVAMSYRFENQIDYFTAGAGVVLVYERGDTIRFYSPAGDNPIIDSTPIDTALYLYDYHIDEPYMYQLYANQLRIMERNGQGDFIQISTFTHDSTMRDIDVGNGIAYIATGTEGILILDVNTPKAPQLITTYSTSASAYRIELFDDLLYYSGSNELWTVDISNPAAPLTVRRLVEVDDPKNIDVAGGYAYVPDGRQGLKIFDVTDRWNPTFVAQFPAPIEAYDVVVRDQIAYLVHSSRISSIDISDPTNPTLLSEIYPFGRVYEVMHHNDILYVRNDDWILLAYSLEDPTTPKLISELERYTNISRVGDTLFAVDLSMSPANQITEIDISNNCTPCLADLSGDGRLNFFDISVFLSTMPDYNEDNRFNYFDVSAFIADFIAGCP